MAQRSTYGQTRKLPSGRFQALVPVGGGTGKSLSIGTFDARAAADDARAHHKRLHGTVNAFDPNKGKVPFLEYAKEYIETGGRRGTLSPKAAENYRDLLAGPLKEWHTTYLSDVQREQVRAWRKRMLASYAKRTDRKVTGERRIEQARMLFAAVMAMAKDDGRITGENPATLPKLAKVKPQKRPLMTMEEFDAAVAALPRRVAVAAVVSIMSGARPGELIALEVRDLNIAERRLTIERTTSEAGSITYTNRPTKTTNRRVVPLTKEAVQVLTAHLEERGHPGQRDLLLVNEEDNPHTVPNLSKAWRRARMAAGIDPLHNFYRLRHTYLSAYTAAGNPMPLVMARGGHTTFGAALMYQQDSDLLSKNEKRALVKRLVPKEDRQFWSKN